VKVLGEVLCEGIIQLGLLKNRFCQVRSACVMWPT